MKAVVKMLELLWKTYHSYETKPNDLIILSANLYENLYNDTILIKIIWTGERLVFSNIIRVVHIMPP